MSDIAEKYLIYYQYHNIIYWILSFYIYSTQINGYDYVFPNR